MAQGQKRSRDVVGVAVTVARIATGGEKEQIETTRPDRFSDGQAGGHGR